MTKILHAHEVLSADNRESNLALTPSAFRKKYGSSEIVYFRGDDEPRDIIERQQAVLQLAKDTGGWVFTGIHSQSDWDKVRWWAAGWRLANRTGDYAVVFDTVHLPPVVTGPASMKRYGKALQGARARKRTTAAGSGIRGLR